jgi:hydroxyacylglutathione hydrolase
MKQKMRISDHIHIIKHNLQKKGGTNCLNSDFVYSLIIFGDRITLINSGPVGAENIIFDYIIKQRRQVEDIDTLILTHASDAFIGAAPAIKLRTKSTIVAHYEESSRIEQFFEQTSKFRVDYSIDASERFNFGCDIDVDLVHIPSSSCGCLSVYFPNHKIYFSENISTTNSDETISGSVKELNYLYSKYNVIKEVEVLISPFSEPITGRRNIHAFFSRSGMPDLSAANNKKASGTHLSNQEFKKAG